MYIYEVLFMKDWVIYQIWDTHTYLFNTSFIFTILKCSRKKILKIKIRIPSFLLDSMLKLFFINLKYMYIFGRSKLALCKGILLWVYLTMFFLYLTFIPSHMHFRNKFCDIASAIICQIQT